MDPLQQVLDRFVVTEPDRPIRPVHMGEIPGDPEARQAIMRRQLGTSPGRLFPGYAGLGIYPVLA